MHHSTEITTEVDMLLARRSLVAMIGASGFARAEEPRTKLVVGTQDIALQETVNASKVLDGIPFDLQWATLPGPAAQLSGLYSKAIDVGLMGDTSLIIEQGRARSEWTHGDQPLQIVAGWRNLNRSYPPIVTAVRTGANISTLADLRGRKWAFNFGGFNYLQYVMTRIKAGLKVTDIEPVQLVDTNAAAAAFNSGRVDVFSGGPGPIIEALTKGAARILIISDDLEIPSLGVFTARAEVLRDPEKSAALADFLNRVRLHWTWYGNNLDTVERILIDKLKQTREKAKYYAASGAAAFRPIDDDLVRREQHIADVLSESGDIARKIDVNLEFSRRFNQATVQTA
jgi:sulfonate transport system substrate-binding protein